MIIGIDASRAFLKERTGIEEYSYQVIKSLRGKLKNHPASTRGNDRSSALTRIDISSNRGELMRGWQVVLYLRKDQSIDFDLPADWQVRVIRLPYLWTQLGLSLEMLWRPVDTLFIPSHTVPIIHPARNASIFSLALFIQKILKRLKIATEYNVTHSDAGGPKNTVVTVHGLEYEVMPQAYSFLARIYMRLSIKKSCLWAEKIIAVSENTKKDLMRIYGVPERKISVVYEGVAESNFEFRISPPRLAETTARRREAGNFESNFNDQISNFQTKVGLENSKPEIDSKIKIKNSKFLLFIGRLEERKNIAGMIKAFGILKEQYHIPHKLVLAGKFGYGEKEICQAMKAASYPEDIVCAGFVREEEKWALLKEADIFLFPSFYEGFGLPVLEAQSVGVPVVTSNVSSLPEIGADSVAYCDPTEPVSIADAVYSIISDQGRKNDIIKKGLENVKRFSWDKCAEEIARLLND